MSQFNHQQDDSGTLVVVLAFIALILFIGAVAAMAYLFS